MSTKYDDMRLKLIEVASTRPDDITMFYNKHLEFSNGCSFLSEGSPREVPLLFRGKLRHFKADVIPFLMAGVDPDSPKKCGNANCINPDHVI